MRNILWNSPAIPNNNNNNTEMKKHTQNLEGETFFDSKFKVYKNSSSNQRRFPFLA
jgi:hypothetical protein